MFTGKMKRCRCCEIERPTELFAMFRNKGSDERYYRSYCRGCRSRAGKGTRLKQSGAPLSDIQAMANRICDGLRARLGLPAFNMIEHVAEKTGAIEILESVPNDLRDQIYAEEYAKADARLKRAETHGSPLRRRRAATQLTPDERAARKKARLERTLRRANAMSPEDLIRQSARSSVRAMGRAVQRVTVNNRGYNTQMPIVKPRAPQRLRGWTLTREQRNEILRRQNGRCAKFGIPFEIVGRDWWVPRHLLSPSLDRIDSSKGYTFENACLVCLGWNLFKNASSEQIAMESMIAMVDAFRTRPSSAARLDSSTRSNVMAADAQ